MKKLLFTLAFALAVTALNAQTLIKANFQKGDQATYESVADIISVISVCFIGIFYRERNCSVPGSTGRRITT